MITKYQRIHNLLLEDIKNGIYEPNEKLPSEGELMKIHNASRDTVRKSLNLLLQNGYIQKAKGKGSIVLDFNKIPFPVSGIVSFKEIVSLLKGEVETKVLKCEKVLPSEEIKKNMHIDDDKVFQIERVRYIDQQRIILDIDFINARIVTDITKKIAQNSLYEYIEGELGLKVSFARKEITVVKATKEDRKKLDLEDYDCVVVVCSYCYLEDTTLFQYTESRHRPDKFRFVDFARREEQ